MEIVYLATGKQKTIYCMLKHLNVLKNIIEKRRILRTEKKNKKLHML